MSIKTARGAKNEALRMWRYLAKTGEEKVAYRRARKWDARCALCDYRNNVYSVPDFNCTVCPLHYCVTDYTSPYYKWGDAKTKKSRMRYAQMIVEKIEAWKID